MALSNQSFFQVYHLSAEKKFPWDKMSEGRERLHNLFDFPTAAAAAAIIGCNVKKRSAQQWCTIRRRGDWYTTRTCIDLTYALVLAELTSRLLYKQFLSRFSLR